MFRRGEVAFVTGAGSGIGAALAEELAARGLLVWVADIARDRADAVAERIAERGGEARAVRLDVTDAAAFEEAVQDAHRSAGRLDHLFNNAGIGLVGEVRDLSLEDWRRTLDVNLLGVVHGIRAAYPLMVEARRGTIVNTASGAGLCPRPGMVPYAAAKHAVVGLSTSLRVEARALGIDVVCVCPGYIRTRIQEDADFRGLDKEGLRRAIPGRGMSARGCALRILRAASRSRAIAPIGPLLGLEWVLYRLWPGLVLRIASWRAKRIRDFRDV